MSETGKAAIICLVFATSIAVSCAAEVRHRRKQAVTISVPKLRQALADCENWDGVSIGRHGERGPLQMKPATWAQFSSKPHAWADTNEDVCHIEADRVELAYTRWLIGACIALKKPVTPYMCGLIHNAGYGTVRGNAFVSEQVEFAMRVSNLYYAK